MLDRAIDSINNADAFYFQLYPLSLSVSNPDCELPAPGTTYRFTVLKGQQKFDQTKLPIQANFRNVNGRNVMVLPRCPVNFYIPSYNKNRGAEFMYNMYQTQNQTEYFIADQAVAIAPYVDQYKKSRTVRFEHTGKFSDDYELQYEIYVEKSRIALEKVVKEYKNQRSLKSPLRERPEEKNPATEKKALTKQPQESTPSQGKDEATQISSSRNKKVEESPAQEEVEKEEVKPTSRTMNQADTERNFEKKESSIREPSFVKKTSKEPSQASKKAVPEMAVLYKAVAKKQSEIKMSSSQRLGTGSVIEPTESSAEPKAESGEKREKILMALFLAFSMVLIYFSMHPNSKV